MNFASIVRKNESISEKQQKKAVYLFHHRRSITLRQPPQEPLSEAGRGGSDAQTVQVSVSDRSRGCRFRQAKEALEPWVPS